MNEQSNKYSHRLVIVLLIGLAIIFVTLLNRTLSDSKLVAQQNNDTTAKIVNTATSENNQKSLNTNKNDCSPLVTKNSIKTKPTFLDVVQTDCEKHPYVGKIISWTGKISNLSQIDGVKFWIIDDQHQPNITTDNDWFWAIPNDNPPADIKHGEWVTYMLKRYGNIDISSIDRDNDIFLIKGKLLELDCTFYDSDTTTTAPCIPNVEVENIKKL